MTLPKHLRPRWRYLAVTFETWPGDVPDRGSFAPAVRDAVHTLFGDAGLARIEPRLLGFRTADATGDAVVRTHRGQVEDLRAALARIETVEGKPIGLRVRGTSGTIRACEEKYLGREPEGSSEKTVVFDDAERPALTRDAAVDMVVDDAFVGATRLDLE